MLALYPPSWSGERADSLRTVLLTEAVTTTLGASLLVWGDDLGCLRHPYYPDYLTGSPAGSWQAPTGPGSCRRVTVSVLLAEPGRWTAAAAVVGRGGDRFAPVAMRQRPHREGIAVEVELPLTGCWSVLRLSQD